MTIGERIANILAKQGKKEVELARYLNTRQSTVSGWTKGGRTPNADVIVPICEFLGVSVKFLLTGGDEEPYVHKEEMPKLFGVKGNQVEHELSDEELKALRLLTNEAVTKRMQEIARQVYKEESKDKDK